MQLVPGQDLADQLLATLKSKISQVGIRPKLAIIQIGEDEPSNIYIRKKLEVSSTIGVATEVFNYSALQVELVKSKIIQLNRDDSVNGIIVQLPTPGTEILDTLDLINPAKDVDGLTSHNLGKVWHSQSTLTLGATPKAIFYTLKYIAEEQNSTIYQILLGKNILIINRNILIGKPLAGVLLNYQATVTIAHSQTQNLNQLIGYADILVCATGQNIINTNNAMYLKNGVIIIDSGFARQDKRVIGDVDPESVSTKASWLTPVPGGIGPLGLATLMQNTYNASVTQLQLDPQHLL